VIPILKGIVWDFDGTLADTRARNLAVNRKIVETVSGRPYQDFPALCSLEEYSAVNRRVRNWRALYLQEFGLDAVAADRAGRLWTEFQLADATPAVLYDGIPAALEALRALRHGIVSQNSAENIRALLRQVGLDDCFAMVIGYEEVRLTRQKPEPDGLLRCVATLYPAERGVVLYIGDHATDTECAFNANAMLAVNDRGIRVIAVAASFDGPADIAGWRIPPDHVVHHPLEIVNIAARYAPWGSGTDLDKWCANERS
jgi:HAD superfamily hydrolase (TIGR01549 family)